MGTGASARRARTGWAGSRRHVSAAASAAAAESAAPAPDQGTEYSEKGADTCLTCHTEGWPYPIFPIFKSKHANRADPRTPRVENAASQQVTRLVELFNEGRFDECGALMAEDMRLEDRRSIVGREVTYSVAGQITRLSSRE